MRLTNEHIQSIIMNVVLTRGDVNQKKERKKMTPKQAHKLVAAQARKSKVSITKFCLLKGVDPSTVSHWRGKTKTLNLNTLEKLLGKIV